MMHLFQNSFINLIFIGIIALFPVVNPVGSAFILSPYFEKLTVADKKKAVNKIVLYAFGICIISLFTGRYILELFGISVPVVRIAGGILICKMGWEFLESKQITEDTKPYDGIHHSFSSISDKLFYPITFPATTGVGTIAVLFTLSTHSHTSDGENYYLGLLAIVVSILVMCAMIYVCYLNSRRVIHMLGNTGEQIVKRISAFLIFCVGLEISFTGLSEMIEHWTR